MKHSVGKQLTAAAANTMFVVPSGYKAEVSTIFVSNNVGQNKTVTVYWQHAHDINHKIYIVTAFVISANQYLIFQDKQLIMQTGDSIVVTPDSDTSMSCIVSMDLYKENTTPFFAD
tara:strand:- start:40 stop:387 length:348 start_codon:yes stop_codon:yes gene_type:complete